jgi:uncharacterized membrane protein YgaE (UPF0421/DUF939 family)
LELAPAKFAFDTTRAADRARRHNLRHRGAAYSNARSILGRDSNAGGDAIDASIERIVATAFGAFAGALEANFFKANLIAFAVAVFLLGLLSIPFRLEKTAYRYASITLAIIVLIPRTAPPWAVALHRFIEVSVGILVALAIVAFWPEHQGRGARRPVE